MVNLGSEMATFREHLDKKLQDKEFKKLYHKERRKLRALQRLFRLTEQLKGLTLADTYYPSRKDLEDRGGS